MPLFLRKLFSISIFYGAVGARFEHEMQGTFSGEIWHIQVVPAEWCYTETQHNKRKCQDKALKPRLSRPHLFENELITMVENSAGNAVLSGPVNGWGVMTDVQLQSLTCPDKSGRKAKYLWQYKMHGGKSQAEVVTSVRGAVASAAANCLEPVSLRGKIVGAAWTHIGWKADAPGFVFHYAALDKYPTVIVGEDIVRAPREEIATKAHIFTHRYAKEEENFKDKLTWHSGIFLEWDHGRYATIIELAWLNGLGGYKGKSNWYYDKLSPKGTGLYKAMPGSMVGPWDSGRSEVRVFDVEMSDTASFKQYLKDFSETGGKPQDEQRFLEPKCPLDSGDVHLYRRSRNDIARYLVNYVRADERYSEINRNCQTFAADLFRFLTGKKATVYTNVMRLAYSPNTEGFTTEPLRGQED